MSLSRNDVAVRRRFSRSRRRRLADRARTDDDQRRELLAQRIDQPRMVGGRHQKIVALQPGEYYPCGRSNSGPSGGQS